MEKELRKEIELLALMQLTIECDLLLLVDELRDLEFRLYLITGKFSQER